MSRKPSGSLIKSLTEFTCSGKCKDVPHTSLYGDATSGALAGRLRQSFLLSAFWPLSDGAHSQVVNHVCNISVEPKVRLQGYGYNPFCSHSSRCLAVLVWQYFEEAFCAPKVRLKWYGFKGFPSHSSHCFGAFFHSTPGSAQHSKPGLGLRNWSCLKQINLGGGVFWKKVW